MLLTAAFLNATEAWTVPRKVLNISSGLGRRPMASQAAYCAAKAGMDHFTRCLALDEARLAQRCQGLLAGPRHHRHRHAGATAQRRCGISFPDQAGFAQFKAAGQLTTTSEAAKRVLAWLARPDFGQQAVADVREASSNLNQTAVSNCVGILSAINAKIVP